MFSTTFLVMDRVIQVQAIPEFVHQDFVKLIGNGGPYKHGCTWKPLPILNLCLITTFLPIYLSTYLNWKIKEIFKEVNETKKKIPPLHMSTSWCEQLNGGVNKSTRRKFFFVTKFPFWECLYCRDHYLFSFHLL